MSDPGLGRVKTPLVTISDLTPTMIEAFNDLLKKHGKKQTIENPEDRKRDGDQTWLFSAVAPDQGRALSAWGKWWSRYLRQTVGIVDADRVFHSFRHGFQDALRRATPDEELRDALSGRSNHKSVGRTYGAKNMLERWGAAILTKAISDISYPGLDLSRVRPFTVRKRTRGNK
jgi:hypothetical protein